MDFQKKIKEIQQCLVEQKVDGWLLYDNHGSNRFIPQLLAISPHQVLTRRFFYWIPKVGEPQKILPRIEAESLDQMPGTKHLYLSWLELEQEIKKVLKNAKRILMEYSPRGANPHVSLVDAGTLELIEELGVEVLTSADVLQRFTSVLDEKQIALHLEAASVVEATVARAWDFIAETIRHKRDLTEYDVQQFILNEFKARNCVSEAGAICAVNGHSALPHYMATQKSAKKIVQGDFILIDLSCKKDVQEGIYADITRVAVAAAHPATKQQEVFEVVKMAQKKGIDFVRERIESGKSVKGFEVDDICRNHIRACGYGEYFIHRTGHNIDTHVHGAGANFDNLETSDHRQLLPGMCFSIEPGIYLANEFGVRLESNLLIRPDCSVQVTGGVEESIVCL
jgi:Xaa-Pro dipeptidase